MPRFVLEGEWTGYTSAQRCVVHRETVDTKRAVRLKSLRSIVYTDGTSLLLSVRPKKPREQVIQMHGYSSLIREAEATGKSRVLVSELPDDD